MYHSLCELRTGRAHDGEKPNLSQVSERKFFSTTVHNLASSAADYQLSIIDVKLSTAPKRAI